MNPAGIELASALEALGVALGAGLLVGLEREQSRKDSLRIGGIRTFALLALLGALGGLLMPAVGWWLPATLGLAVCGALVGAALLDHREHQPGMTTEIAGLVVHVLGLLAVTPIAGLSDVGRWSLVAAAAILTMALLSLRAPLHSLAERVSSEDLYATAKLGVVLLVALPLLPREPLGPIPVVSPFEVGLMVALIAGVGFVGYVTSRLLGPGKGMVLTGLVGGLVSSTAVTLNFAGRTREEPSLAPVAALGIAVASTIMLPRMLLVIAVTAPGLLGHAAVPIGAMAAAGLGAVGVSWMVRRRRAPVEANVVLRNPFSLEQAIKFGGVYVLILVLADFATKSMGGAGLYLAAALAGITDVDAITLSIARLYRDGLDPDLAQTALLLAAGVNTVVKGAMALVLGGRGLGMRVAGIFVPMIALGALALALAR